MSTEASQPCCLIVEDQALISLSLEAYFNDMGFAVMGPFVTRAEAFAALEAERPEIAILDYNLGDGPCDDLARALKARDVPFIVYSGRARPADLPSAFEGSLWLEKPVDRTLLLAGVRMLLDERTALSRA